MSRDTTGLIPYSTLLSRSLTEWLAFSQQSSSDILLSHIRHHANLNRTLKAVSSIFLSSSGAAFQSFADSIFARLDDTRLSSGAWAAPLAIEDLARTAFAPLLEVDTARLTAQHSRVPNTVTVSRRGHKRAESSKATANTIESLAAVQLHYSISPTLQNIIPSSALSIYASTSIFLLQLLRPITLLSRLPLSSIPAAALSLRQRLLHALTTIRGHILTAGIAAAERTLMRVLDEAESVDGMRSAHEQFCRSVERRCFGEGVEGLRGVRDCVLGMAELGVAFVGRCRAGKSGEDKKYDAENDSDEEIDEEMMEDEAQVQTSGLDATSVRQMQGQLSELVGLIVAGLRSASREGEVADTRYDGNQQRRSKQDEAEESWGMLATELESSLHSGGRSGRRVRDERP